VAGFLLYGIGRFTLPRFAKPANLVLLAWLVAVGIAMSVAREVSARRFVLAFLTFLLAAGARRRPARRRIRTALRGISMTSAADPRNRRPLDTGQSTTPCRRRRQPRNLYKKLAFL
jgi:hypothetical protein